MKTFLFVYRNNAKDMQQLTRTLRPAAQHSLVSRTSLPLIVGCVVTEICETSAAERTLYFDIQVVDDATGRGVPLVELRTVNDISYYTDSAGHIAFHEPGLMN